MQPYFFPYIGYFQLVNAADKFVFFDDVNFRKKGYINRNEILVSGQKSLFSIPLANASQNSKISEVLMGENFLEWKNKFLKTLAASYCKSPYYSEVLEVLSLTFDATNIAEMASKSIMLTMQYLGIERQYKFSSKIDYDRSGDGQSKILSLCSKLETEQYLNAIGGKELYNLDVFSKQGVKLNFIEMETELVAELIGEPHISMLHTLFNYKPEVIKASLMKYRLVN